jgi:hypothetical protein
MPNSIKYTTGSESLALKKGNFWIGTGDVGKGPTNTTGYWNGITPPEGGYTIYLNKETGGPSIYTVSNDDQLISLTNSIAGTSYTTANECLVYFAGQTDKLCVNIDYEGIITDGLIVNVDAGFTPSYPKNGTTIYDIASNPVNGSLINGPTFNSSDGGSIVLDGVDDYIVGSLVVPASFTFNCIFKPTNITVWSPEFNIWQNYPSGDRGWGIFCIHSGGGAYPTGVYAGTDISTRWNNNETTGVYSTNNIQNITFTHGNGVSRIYRNGSLLYQKNQSAPLSIGQTKYYTLFSHPTYGPGNLYTAQFYNRELSSSEVLHNFNSFKSRFGL